MLLPMKRGINIFIRKNRFSSLKNGVFIIFSFWSMFTRFHLCFVLGSFRSNDLEIKNGNRVKIGTNKIFLFKG